MIESWQLAAAVKDALSAKRFAAAVGRTLQTIYSWTRDPHDPEQDGSTNLFDWMEAVIDALAARPEGRPVITRIRLWFLAVTDRALGAFQPRPATRDELAMHTSETVREFSELLAQCCPDGFDADRIMKEGTEAIDAIKRLLSAVQEGVQEEELEHQVAVRAMAGRKAS